MSLGTRIYGLRKDHGMTRDEFAKFLGVSRSTIQRWELGDKIDSDTLLAISKKFNVSIDWLVAGARTENLAFCNSTGLSEESVFALSVNDKKLATSVNYLVENGCSFTIDAIARYLAESAQIHIDSVEEPLTKEQAESLVWLLENITMAKLYIRKVVCNRCSKKD